MILDIRQSVELACILEAVARKPGNVSPNQEFADLTLGALLTAGIAIGPILAAAPYQQVGATVLAAIQATRTLLPSNANLGLVLLLTPMAAAERHGPLSLDTVALILAELTVADARLVYEAIRLANPGGLGQVTEQDVQAEPTVDLRAAMALARERDTIALLYADGFDLVPKIGATAIQTALAAALGLELAILWCQWCWLAHRPDSLIARKFGLSTAAQVQAQGCQLVEQWQHRLSELPTIWSDPYWQSVQRQWSQQGCGWNPGTTADLVAASLYWLLRTGQLDVARTSFLPRTATGLDTTGKTGKH